MIVVVGVVNVQEVVLIFEVIVGIDIGVSVILLI
jgi:hypothetical protein